MGSPKALLGDADGRPFVARVARTLLTAGLPDVVVITGSQHERIASALATDGLDRAVRLARNPDPSRGQLSSIWTGLDSCPPDAEGLLMTLVDVPLLAAATVSTVVDAWRVTRAPIVRPIVDGRRGHPVIFDRQVFDELRAAPLSEGARIVVRAHWAESLDVLVDDPGCLIDIDTPTDYNRVVGG
jgi:molybdenum cofactor cytidylyltransferase